MALQGVILQLLSIHSQAHYTMEPRSAPQAVLSITTLVAVTYGTCKTLASAVFDLHVSVTDTAVTSHS